MKFNILLENYKVNSFSNFKILINKILIYYLILTQFSVNIKFTQSSFLNTLIIEGDFMTRKYDPKKVMYKIWRICENPLNLTITHESNNGRYVLSDASKLYGRILDLNEEAIYAGTYLVNILKFGGPWHKYSATQDQKPLLLQKVKTIWYTDRESKPFSLEDYQNRTT